MTEEFGFGAIGESISKVKTGEKPEETTLAVPLKEEKVKVLEEKSKAPKPVIDIISKNKAGEKTEWDIATIKLILESSPEILSEIIEMEGLTPEGKNFAKIAKEKLAKQAVTIIGTEPEQDIKENLPKNEFILQFYEEEFPKGTYSMRFERTWTLSEFIEQCRKDLNYFGKKRLVSTGDAGSQSYILLKKYFGFSSIKDISIYDYQNFKTKFPELKLSESPTEFIELMKKEFEEEAIPAEVRKIQSLILKKMPTMLPKKEMSPGGKIFEEIKKSFEEQGFTKKWNLALDNLAKKGKVRFYDLTKTDDLNDKQIGQIREFAKLKGLFDNKVKQIYGKPEEMREIVFKERGLMQLETGGEALKMEIQATKVSPEILAELQRPYTTYDCTKFPNLEGIYFYYPQCRKYFESREVYIPEDLLRLILSCMERDTSFILYGEPGDGKSLIINTLLDWLTTQYNCNPPDHPFGGNPNLSRKSRLPPEQIGQNIIEGRNLETGETLTIKDQNNAQWGTWWRSMNVSDATNENNLYGGYAPESIGGGIENLKNRQLTTEKGIITDGVMTGKYIFLDELNRVDQEVLAKLMGFLQAPNSYEVPEGKWRIVYKSLILKTKRANFNLMGSMNVGDTGNFQMSFAFKRRFSIIQVHYTPEEVVQISKFVKGYKPKHMENLQNLCKKYLGDPKIAYSLSEAGEKFIQNMALGIYNITHQWKKDNLTQFGAGVAHIFATLAELALYMRFLVQIDYAQKTLHEITNRSQFKEDLRKLMDFAIHNNVLMMLVNEGDKYKMNQMQGRHDELVKTLTEAAFSIMRLVIDTASIKTGNANKRPDQCGLNEILAAVLKF